MKNPFHENSHPVVIQAQQSLEQGRISRREFLRVAALVGMSYGGAQLLEALSPQTALASSIKRGGTMRIGYRVHGLDHPARDAHGADTIIHHVIPNLAWMRKDNIAQPWLLEGWEASDDLTKWTLNLKQGLVWTNGDEFTAEDVQYTFGEWLNKDTASSVFGLFNGFLTPDGVEVVDNYKVVLHLEKPLLAVPESLTHYPAMVLHRNFSGDMLDGNLQGLGPWVIDEYIVDERARLVPSGNSNFMGEDGQALPYLDTLEYLDLGEDQAPYQAALKAGELHMIPRWEAPEQYSAYLKDPRFTVDVASTGRTAVARMRVDQDPWKDNRVRTALKICQERQKILDGAILGQGILGHDTHVSPVHPEWVDIPLPEYDPERSKKLLAEAGYPDGLEVTLAVNTGRPETVPYAEVLAESAKAGGWNIVLDAMSGQAHGAKWNIWNFSITTWGHRSPAVMMLPLAYTKDSEGNPVPWNESYWVDDEFSEILVEAQGTFDLEARKELVHKLALIQQERGSIGISYWRNLFRVTNRAFHNVSSHPNEYSYLDTIWYDPNEDPFA